MCGSAHKGVVVLGTGTVPEECGDLQAEVFWVWNERINCCLRHYNSRVFMCQTHACTF